MKKRFEGTDYFVDTEGNIYGKNGKVLKYSINHKGYAIVNLMINGKRKGFAVHTIVAKTFIPNPNNYLTVNHKDGNKLRNSIDNLEWQNYKQQMQHAKDILHFEYNKNVKKKVIRQSKSDEYYYNSLSEAAKDMSNKYGILFNSAKNSIWRVLNDRRKTYKGFRWKYQ